MPVTPTIAPQVRQILDGTARLIGIGNRCKLEWRRTGGNIELIGGDADWSLQNIYGRLGSFSLTLPESMPIHSPKLGYELQDNGRWRIQASADVDEPNGKVGSPVGSLGIGAVFSLLAVAWSLLHPRATLEIPPQVEVELLMTNPDLLEVKFITPPTLQCVWGIRFSCEPLALRLKPNHAAVDYKAMVFQRTEEWSW